MQTSFSEQLFYEAIARIAIHLGWKVVAEYPLIKKGRTSAGDHRRIDFKFSLNKDNLRRRPTPENTLAIVGLEVKFFKSKAKSRGLPKDLGADADKLVEFSKYITKKDKVPCWTYILVLGHGEDTNLSDKKMVWDLQDPIFKRKNNKNITGSIKSRKCRCCKGGRTAYFGQAFEVLG